MPTWLIIVLALCLAGFLASQTTIGKSSDGSDNQPSRSECAGYRPIQNNNGDWVCP
jgi:hypothetical protein